MKKIMTIVLFSIIMASSCLFAATETFKFNMVWRHIVGGTTTMSIMDYDATGVLPDSEKELTPVDTEQNVARIRYTTNEGGIHTLAFKATALKTDDNSSHVGFRLFFDYEGRIAVLNVGDELNTYYPEEVNSVTTVFNVPYGSASSTVADVFVRALLTEIDEMQSSVAYKSTVMIERITN